MALALWLIWGFIIQGAFMYWGTKYINGRSYSFALTNFFLLIGYILFLRYMVLLKVGSTDFIDTMNRIYFAQFAIAILYPMVIVIVKNRDKNSS